MKTLIGQLLRGDGLAAGRELAEGPTGPQLRVSAFSTPVAQTRRRQPEWIPVDWQHDGQPVGEVVDLQVRGSGASATLWAVAHANITIPDWFGDVYFSVKGDSARDGSDFALESVGLCSQTKTMGISPVIVLDGAIDYRQVVSERWNWDATRLPELEAKIMTRAASNYLDRRVRGGPLLIDDIPRAGALEQVFHRNHGGELAALTEDYSYDDQRPPGPMHYSAPFPGKRAILAVNGVRRQRVI